MYRHAITLNVESAADYMRMERGICQSEACFEPQFLALGKSLESLLSMVARGRGVFLAPELLDRQIAVSFHVLDGLKSALNSLS